MIFVKQLNQITDDSTFHHTNPGSKPVGTFFLDRDQQTVCSHISHSGLTAPFHLVWCVPQNSRSLSTWSTQPYIEVDEKPVWSSLLELCCVSSTEKPTKGLYTYSDIYSTSGCAGVWHQRIQYAICMFTHSSMADCSNTSTQYFIGYSDSIITYTVVIMQTYPGTGLAVHHLHPFLFLQSDNLIVPP